MAYTIVLKNRTTKDIRTISIPVTVLESMIASGSKEKLWDYFSGIAANIEENSAIHDKLWLEAIVNWVPQDGLQMTEMAKWLQLAKRVANLDDTRESGNFTLSQYQVDLIWSRLNDQRFKLRAVSSQFIDFIIDFQEVTGKHFNSEDPDPGPGIADV